MTKKILLIIGILVIVGLAVFLILGSKPQTESGSENRVGFSIRQFLPFGKNTDSETDGGEDGVVNEDIVYEDLPSNDFDEGETKTVPRLRKISSEPVGGAVIFNMGTTSVVRFVEKGTGNVYEARSDTTNIERLTNTTIPRVVRAFWLPNGSGFLAQTILNENETIETNFVKLNKNPVDVSEDLTPFNTIISKLPTDIKEIAIKPDGSKIFYYTAGASSEWFISNPDGTQNVLLLTHSLTEWLPKWISANTIAMQTKGSSASVGFSYFLDVSAKNLKKVGGGAIGISTNPNGNESLSLVSSGGSAPQLFVFNTKNASSTKVNLNVLAEKCVWLKDKNPSFYCAVPNQIPKGAYPDDWYKGLISFEDFMAKVDVNNDIFYNVADLTSLSKQKIDVSDLNLSPDETHLIFRNKIDGFLWMLRIDG